MKSERFKECVKVTKTRFSDENCSLYIGHIAPNVWQCVVEQDGNMAQTGDICRTKAECFSVLPKVAEIWGL